MVKRKIIETCTDADVEESDICSDNELDDVENIDGEVICIICKKFDKNKEFVLPVSTGYGIPHTSYLFLCVLLLTMKYIVFFYNLVYTCTAIPTMEGTATNKVLFLIYVLFIVYLQFTYL